MKRNTAIHINKAKNVLSSSRVMTDVSIEQVQSQACLSFAGREERLMLMNYCCCAYKMIKRSVTLSGKLFLLSFLTMTVSLYAQETRQKVTVSVTDEENKPLQGVEISTNEGDTKVLTGQDGKATIETVLEETISVETKGFEKKLVPVARVLEEEVVILEKAKLYAGTQDRIPLPFTTVKRRNTTGTFRLLSGDQLDTYPSTDIRNAFAGRVPGFEVVELHGMPGLSAEEWIGALGLTTKVSLNTRGTNPIFIIDDLMVDITEMPLDPHEIESVSFISDIVGKALYGPHAANGIIYIKTKRGKAYRRGLQVSTETGVSITDRFPDWVTGADYARLNNLARQNSGMDPLYSSGDIAAYEKNDPYDLYHPNINFRDMLYKDTRSLTRVNVSTDGGNDNVQYFAYLGYNGEGDNFNMGSSANYNRINARSNIDIRITEDIKVQLGIYGGLTIRNAPSYGYYTSDASSVFSLVEMNSLMNDMTTIPPIAFPVYAAYDEKENKPWYAVSSAYGSNPVGKLTSNGYYEEKTRTSAAHAALDYSLDKFIPGLTSRTFFTFNVLNLTRIGKAEEYIAYTVTPSKTTDGRDTTLLTKVHDGVDMDDQIKLHDYYYQRLSFYQKLNYERTFGDHDLRLGLTYLLANGLQDLVREPDRLQNGIVSADYGFRDKYFFEGVLNYSGASSFDKGNRYEFFPSVGLGWVISEEKFLQKARFIDFLKLRAQAGILGYNGLQSTTFYYDDNWTTNTGTAFGPHSANQWFGSDTDNSVYQTYPNRIANPNLTWEKRREFNVGLDALLLNKKLELNLTYYHVIRDGIISKLSNAVPLLTGYYAASPWFNYNKYKYYGLEAGIQYSDQLGKLHYSVGGNATLRNSERLRFDEPNYRENYLFRTGKPVDAIFGYTYLGKFATDAEAQAVDQDFDERLLAGDLKYKDLNGDSRISELDISQIGHNSPRLVYAVNLHLDYRRFELKVVGTGCAFYDIAMTNKYFWNGWGDNTYSRFVQENIGGDYPRLTWQKVNNNFVTSGFWLRKGGFFKIQNAELAYNLRPKDKKLLGTENIRIYVRGANLLTFSKIDDVDPESVNAGVGMYPLFRTFTGGLQLTF